MAESHRSLPPHGEAGPFTRDTRPAALTGNGGMEAWHAVASRRWFAITLLEADG